MKNLQRVLFSTLSLIATSNYVMAASGCSVNGKAIPCDQMPKGFFAFMGLFGFVFMAIMFAMIIFWFWMFIDAIKNEKENLALWLIILIFASGIGAIAYYFARYRSRKKSGLKK